MTGPQPQEGARIFLASRNAKKLGELERILAPLVPGLRVVGLDEIDHYDEPVEDAPTFEGNALIKARAGYRASGLPTVADDSGLCVDALNGMPGVLSARWGGRVLGAKDDADARNNRLLLDQLSDVPDERRGAHFTAAVAFVHGENADAEIVVEGRMEGRVLREPRGAGGFGYDPLFVADETPDGRSSAELTVAEKDAVSHRGKALREIAPLIAAVLS